MLPSRTDPPILGWFQRETTRNNTFCSGRVLYKKTPILWLDEILQIETMGSHYFLGTYRGILIGFLKSGALDGFGNRPQEVPGLGPGLFFATRRRPPRLCQSSRQFRPTRGRSSERIKQGKCFFGRAFVVKGTLKGQMKFWVSKNCFWSSGYTRLLNWLPGFAHLF